MPMPMPWPGEYHKCSAEEAGEVYSILVAYSAREVVVESYPEVAVSSPEEAVSSPEEAVSYTEVAVSYTEVAVSYTEVAVESCKNSTKNL